MSRRVSGCMQRFNLPPADVNHSMVGQHLFRYPLEELIIAYVKALGQITAVNDISRIVSMDRGNPPFSQSNSAEWA